MIEKMKVVQIVSLASRKDQMLDDLRKLGLVHFAEKRAADQKVAERFTELSKTAMMLTDYAGKKPVLSDEILSDEDFEALYSKILATADRKKDLAHLRNTAATNADKIRGWGDFSPAQVEELRKEGVNLHFYRLDKKLCQQLAADEHVRFIRLAAVDKMDTIAVIGKLPGDIPATEFKLPEHSLSELDQQVAACDMEIEQCDKFLKSASKYIPSFNDQMLKAQNAEEYSSMSNTVDSEEGLIWLTGYIPEADCETFKEAAAANGWAWAMDDPDDDDEKIPTKVKYTKLTKLISPVFELLGTVPGYREYDISFWFLGFFTLFFAMIIGDAGYGVIFLLLAIGLNIKNKGVNNLTLLLYVLSVGTIVWGALTGTWFGAEAAMKIPFLRSLVIPSFANYPQYFGVSTVQQQNAIMKFCFIIGTVQLSLACVMNIRKKLGQKDLSWIADVGWLGAIIALYFLVLFLVIGENIELKPVAIVVIAGFLLVVIFGGMSPDKSFGQGLKAGVGDAFTCFLNTISAFGNVMSYIRLFAVGMASLAIAQSFNSMGSGFSGPMAIAGAVIIVIGHLLNIVMGLLSVIVHGVRLNLLEFSGQLGMEWSGIEYNPFKKLDKIKK